MAKENLVEMVVIGRSVIDRNVEETALDPLRNLTFNRVDPH